MKPLSPTERKIVWLDEMIHWSVKQERTEEISAWLPWATSRITELASNGERHECVAKSTRIKVTIDDLL